MSVNTFYWLLLLAGVIGYSPVTAQVNVLRIDQAMNHLLDSAGIPGMSLAVIDHGEIALVGNYGVRDNRRQVPVDENTIFEAASLTKPVAAYCAMKLVEAGKLDLDKPLFEYLEYPDLSHDQRYLQITARMVLSHQSGLPNWRKNRGSNHLEMKSDPGKKFGYSGEGFVYLQKVMENIEGKDLNAIAREMVFEPLQMKNSSLVFPETEDYAIGHNFKKRPNRKGKPNRPNAAYSMHTTAADYGRFMMELMNPAFAEQGTVARMMEQQVLMDPKEPSLGWGLGVGINTTNQDKYIWHWGDNSTFRCFFIFSRKGKTGFVYFTNSQNGLSIVRRMIRLTYQDPEVMANWNKYKQF